MNRSTFFKTLGIGLASAPTLAKVLAEEPNKLTFAKIKEMRDMMEDLNSRDIQQQIAHHIATTNPYAGLLFEKDQRPLRFNA